MLGNPKYNYGDKVKFTIEGHDIVGTVEIIDAYGTFEQNEEVSYDILGSSEHYFNGEPCLFKHIIETHVSPAD